MQGMLNHPGHVTGKAFLTTVTRQKDLRVSRRLDKAANGKETQQGYKL